MRFSIEAALHTATMIVLAYGCVLNLKEAALWIRYEPRSYPRAAMCLLIAMLTGVGFLFFLAALVLWVVTP